MTRALFAVLALLISATASAENLYVYGALGLQSTFHIDRGQRDTFTGTLFPGAPQESTVTENDGTAGKLMLGYQFSPRIAIEIGYADFGKASYFARFVDHPTPVITRVFTSQEEWSARGVVVSAFGNVPIRSGFSLLGRIGAARTTLHFTRSTNLNFGASPSADESQTKWSPNAGIGLGFDVPGRLPIGFRLEHERVQGVGNDATGGKRNIDVTSLGVIVRF